VLTHASIVCEGMLASVNSVKLYVGFMSKTPHLNIWYDRQFFYSHWPSSETPALAAPTQPHQGGGARTVPVTKK